LSLRPAIVTGGSSGIGREIAVALAGSGCGVIVTGRNLDRLEETAQMVSQGMWVTAGEITDPEFQAGLIESAREIDATGLPILVNAAGIAEFGATAEVSAESLQRQIEINLLAAMQLCRLVLPWMLEAGGGDIVNVGSIASVHPFPGAAGYVASKAGLLAFTRSLANEYRKDGIRTLSILPGSVRSEFWLDKPSSPPKELMLPPIAVGEAVRDAVQAPRDRSFDEILLMPPNGIL